jgi:hypothetical protein
LSKTARNTVEATVPQQIQSSTPTKMTKERDTPLKKVSHGPLFKGPRRSPRLAQKSLSTIDNAENHPVTASKFISGHINGKSIYSVIRVVPQHLVNEIENLIAAEDKNEASGSEMQKNMMVSEE